MKHNFLVVVSNEFVDGTAFIGTPEGEMGGQGYIETKSPCDLVLGEYEAVNPNEARRIAADRWDISEEVIVAYQLAPQHSPLEEAIRIEVDYIVNEYPDEYNEKQKQYMKENIHDIIDSISYGFDNFTGDVREMLDGELKEAIK